MAECQNCHKDMLSVDGCVSLPIVVDGITYLPIPYGQETRFGEDWCKNMPADKRCHDCNTKKGNFHHPGCDMEQCPKCGCQIIGCGCTEEEEKS